MTITLENARHLSTPSVAKVTESQERVLVLLIQAEHKRHNSQHGLYVPAEICDQEVCKAMRESWQDYVKWIADHL